MSTDNPSKNPALTGFDLTADERADVLAFLRALTDPRSDRRGSW